MHHTREKPRPCRLLFCALLFILTIGSAAAQEPLIPDDAKWRYHAEAAGPDPSWFEPLFDDSSWRVGVGGFGYGDGDDTTILADMRDRYTNVFIRREFELTTLPQSLFFHVSYDDAFVAYLNGAVVALGSIDPDGEVQQHEAERAEIFKLSTEHVVLGRNVLAIRGINVDASSSDFSLHPALSTELIDPRTVSREAAQDMLESLRDRLLTQSSYLRLTDRDPVAALDAFAGSLPESLSRLGLLGAMQQIVALVGDGHARVSAEFERDGALYLPFGLAEADVGIVAVDLDQQAFVDSAYPLVVAIDGIDVERWVAAAARYVSKASPQLNRRRALRSVQRVDQLRYDLQLPAANTVSVTFGNGSGDTRIQPLSLSLDRPSTPRVTIGRSRKLDGNIGYLVIPEMDDERIPDVLRWMKKFRKTDGLVIDVRSNSGGRYGILRALAPYFIAPDVGPIVTNIAKYRLAPTFDEDHLASRPTFRQAHASWTVEEKHVIADALKSFRPSWTPPEEEFSDWHFMLLNKKSERRRGVYFYDKPVIVLSNTECFSATDGFLAAFSEFQHVTIVGQPSSGGSGRTQRFTLPENGLRSRDTAIRVALSSMASFRPSGELFDGVGIPVDVHVEPHAQDFIAGSDNVLTKALDLLSLQMAERPRKH